MTTGTVNSAEDEPTLNLNESKHPEDVTSSYQSTDDLFKTHLQSSESVSNEDKEMRNSVESESTVDGSGQIEHFGGSKGSLSFTKQSDLTAGKMYIFKRCEVMAW